MQRRNARVGRIVLLMVVCMVGLSFASVPLYRLFCQVTGFGGTTQSSQEAPLVEVLDRKVRVQFNADVNPDLSWNFKPEQRGIDVQLGQRGLASFSAENTGVEPVAGTALYNVTPLKVGKYFHKIQCFCFDEQVLQPGERVSMPVLFYIDPEMNEDPNMKDVSVITLSYTFFKTEGKELEQALEAFYNDGVVE